MASWPSELPQYPLVNGYSRAAMDSTIAFAPDAGKPKRRNRATGMPDIVTEQYVIEKNQYTVFDNFYKVDAGRGTIPFIKPEPETGLNVEYNFTAPPEYNFQGTHYIVTVQLERLY